MLVRNLPTEGTPIRNPLMHPPSLPSYLPPFQYLSACLSFRIFFWFPVFLPVPVPSNCSLVQTDCFCFSIYCFRLMVPSFSRLLMSYVYMPVFLSAVSFVMLCTGFSKPALWHLVEVVCFSNVWTSLVQFASHHIVVICVGLCRVIVWRFWFVSS